jgi:trehalose 6-phosphate phosphatase
VDGTLLDVADHPDNVRTTPRLKLLLRRAALELDGAVALVCGRAIADPHRLSMPLQLPMAGVHGIERRSADGTVDLRARREDQLHSVKRELMDIVQSRAGLLMHESGWRISASHRILYVPGVARHGGPTTIVGDLRRGWG